METGRLECVYRTTRGDELADPHDRREHRAGDEPRARGGEDHAPQR